MSRLRRLGLAVLACAALAGCDRGRSTDGTCSDDRGCPAGARCLVGTGVCVSFTTPLGDDGGAGCGDASACGDAGAPPDLAPGVGD